MWVNQNYSGERDDKMEWDTLVASCFNNSGEREQFKGMLPAKNAGKVISPSTT
jgi:hypothetical protein